MAKQIQIKKQTKTSKPDNTGEGPVNPVTGKPMRI